MTDRMDTNAAATIPVNARGEPYCNSCRAWHKGNHLPSVEHAIRTARQHMVVIGPSLVHGAIVTVPPMPANEETISDPIPQQMLGDNPKTPEMLERVARQIAQNAIHRQSPLTQGDGLQTLIDHLWESYITDAYAIISNAMQNPTEAMTRPLRELFRGPAGATISHEMMCVAWSAVIAAAVGKTPKD